MRRRSTTACALALAAALACAPGADERPQRVVLITLDTLRWSAWAGVERAPPMPRTVERLAAGLVFERAYAATSSTQPTHASLFTGLHPWEHGVTRNGLVLGPQYDTLAERLRAAGFETRAVVASFPLSVGYGFEQGFVAYEDTFDVGLPDQETWNDAEVPGDAFYSLAGEVTARALAQLDEAEGPRQFFWFHYFDAHDPYGDAVGDRSLDVGALREAALEQDPRLQAALVKARALYLADAGALDASLDTLLARLERDAGTYETHVVITSDHGESFGEDGSLGHGARVTPSQVHVPLGVLSPRVAPAVREDACGSIDVFATLLDLAGLPPGEGPARSLLAPAPPDGGAAYGMRRTYDEPTSEVRVDGRRVPVGEPRFFAVVGGALVAGRAGALESLVAGAGPPDGAAGEALSQRFAGFEAVLGEVQSLERDDEASLEALRALGYTR